MNQEKYTLINQTDLQQQVHKETSSLIGFVIDNVNILKEQAHLENGLTVFFSGAFIAGTQYYTSHLKQKSNQVINAFLTKHSEEILQSLQKQPHLKQVVETKVSLLKRNQELLAQKASPTALPSHIRKIDTELQSIRDELKALDKYNGEILSKISPETNAGKTLSTLYRNQGHAGFATYLDKAGNVKYQQIEKTMQATQRHPKLTKAKKITAKTFSALNSAALFYTGYEFINGVQNFEYNPNEHQANQDISAIQTQNAGIFLSGAAAPHLTVSDKPAQSNANPYGIHTFSLDEKKDLITRGLTYLSETQQALLTEQQNLFYAHESSELPPLSDEATHILARQREAIGTQQTLSFTKATDIQKQRELLALQQDLLEAFAKVADTSSDRVALIQEQQNLLNAQNQLLQQQELLLDTQATAYNYAISEVKSGRLKLCGSRSSENGIIFPKEIATAVNKIVLDNADYLFYATLNEGLNTAENNRQHQQTDNRGINHQPAQNTPSNTPLKDGAFSKRGKMATLNQHAQKYAEVESHPARTMYDNAKTDYNS